MATYHEGEIEVQTRAGVRAMAEQVGHSIRNLISPSAAAFAPLQRLAIVGSVASDGGVWASAVAGEPGYLSVPDLHSLQVATPRTDDPLWTNLQQNPAIGVLILDPVMRRRLRINGRAELTDQGFLLRVEQAYTNCAQYIQQRAPEITAMDPGERRQMHSRLLLPRQQAWIVGADTFFLATAHPAIGTDASHRGGMPGFVQIAAPDRLAWPDYSGNTMLQSLGNLSVNPNAGLLFVDFEAGATLQLTGQAKIFWEGARLAGIPGAQRLIEFTIREALETGAALGLRWRLVEYSPVNPRT